MSIVDKKRFENSGHYLGLPASYDDLFVQNRVKLMENIPDFFTSKSELVEIGCGNGNTIFMIADKFKKCTGIDIFEGNQKSFETTKKKLAIDNVEFVLKDIEQDSICKQYDRLICFEVIEHLKLESSVNKFYDLVKKGGKIAITVPHKWWIFETHGANLPLLPWNRVPFFSWLPRPIHEKYSNARIYTKKRIVKLITKAGFQVKDAKLMTAPLDVLKEGKIKSFLKNSIFKNATTKNPLIATNVFIYAQK